MKKFLRKYWILILLFFFTFNVFAEQESILQQVGRELFSGLFKANYLEAPIEQYIPINHLLLSEIKLPNSPSHPSLLFNVSIMNLIRRKSLRSPYSEWAENLIYAAITSQHDPSSPLICEFTRSKIAKLNSFSWFLTGNDEFLTEAKTALLNILETRSPINGEGGIPNEGWGDWMQAAEALRNYAVAYDLIFPELSIQQKTFIERRLADKTNQIYKNFSRFPSSLNSVDLSLGLGITKNNHIIQIATAVATASMILDNPNSDKWFNEAILQLQAGLALIMADGSYQEGPYYGRYINSILYPFFFYINNITGENLFRHPIINKFNQWMLDMELPDGSLPYIDDSWNDIYLYKPIGVGLSPLESELSYLYSQHENIYNDHDLNYIEAFCAFNDRVQPRPPKYNNFYPEGGFTIYRGKNEIVGTFLGEPGRPFISYHDHVEPGSFSCFALGHHFLIDAGYGPEGVFDKNRDWFVSARSHNIPLVNGMGPDLNPIWGDDLDSEMKDFFSMKNLTASSVKANYRETEITRRIWLVNEELFVVYDQMYSSDENRYSIPWQSLGTFKQISSNQVSWQQEDAELQAEFLTISQKPFSLSNRLGLNSHKTNKKIPHTIADISFSPAQETELVSLFLPVDLNNQVTFFEPLAVTSSNRVEARIIRNQETDTSVMIIFAQADWECVNTASDAEIAIIQEIDMNTIFSLESATYLNFENEPIFESDEPVNLTFDLENQEGYLCVKENSTLKFYLNADPGIVILDRQIVEYTWQNDALTFQTNRSGILQFGSITSNITSSQNVRNDLSILERLNSSAFPEEEFASLNYYEKMQLRNEIIDIAAPQTLNAVNGFIGQPAFLQNLYGFTAGFFRYTYQSFEDYKFKFPQSFRFVRQIGNYNIRYYEEGFIIPKGVDVAKHRLSVQNGDKSLYYSCDRDFNDYQSNSLQLKCGNYFSRTDWQQYNSESSYQVEIRRDNANGWIDLSHQKNEFAEFQLDKITFSQNNLSSEISSYSNEEISEYNFSVHSTSHKLSFGMNSSLSDQAGLEKIDLSNSINLNKHSRLSTNLLIQDSVSDEESLDYAVNSSFLADLLGFINLSDFRKDVDNNIFFQNRTTYRYKNWRFSAAAVYDSLLFGVFSTAFRNPDYSVHTSFRKNQRFDISGSYNLNLTWTTMANFTWDFQRNEYKKMMFGLFYKDLQRIGTQLLIKKNSSSNFYGMAGILEIYLFKYERLNLSPEFWWNETGKLESFCLDISQIGKSISPGILIIQDNNELLRCEGYLSWKF